MDEMNNGYVNQTEETGQEHNKNAGSSVRFIIPVAVFIGLVLILAGVAAATGMFSDRKKIITQAFTNTFAQSAEAVGKVWQMEEYSDIFADGQYAVDMDFNLDGYLQLEMQIDTSKDAYGAFFDIGYFGSSLLQANLYVDETELLFGMPYYIGDYVFYVDRDSLNEDVQNLIRNGLIDEETADYIRTLNEGSRNVDFQDDELKQGFKELAGEITHIFHTIKVEKAESKSLTIDGGKKNCKGYVVTLTGQHLADYFLSIKEVYEKNEAFRNYCNESAALGAGFSSTEDFLSIYDPARLLEEYAQEIDAQKELDIYFYINKKVLAQVYTEFGEGNSHLELEWNILGGSFPLENTEFILSSSTDEFVLSRRGSMEKNSYEAEYEMKMDDQGMIITLEYDKDRGDFQINAGFDNGIYLTTLLLEGDIDRSKELRINLDNLEIDEEEILAGEITIYDKPRKIEKPEGKKLDILKMSEEEWEEIIEEIFNNM